MRKIFAFACSAALIGLPAAALAQADIGAATTEGTAGSAKMTAPTPPEKMETKPLSGRSSATDKSTTPDRPVSTEMHQNSSDVQPGK